MRIVMFYHSLISDWNHGNAHFLRGMVTELLSRGHWVDVCEPQDAWSRQMLIKTQGRDFLPEFQSVYPRLISTGYTLSDLDLDEVLDEADLVLVHEWNEPELVNRLAEHRRNHSRYRLLFHDTHHRSLSAAEQIGRFNLTSYDGVLAFGERIRQIYLQHGWNTNIWVWHEAADVRVFKPMLAAKDIDLIWIGNWGDDERSAEISRFLIEPSRRLALNTHVYGVQYGPAVRAELAASGISYRGWTPNYFVPRLFARAKVTVHIPRRYYTHHLPGIPTIRPFEAMACGIPLVCAPWDDAEHLFNPGSDYLVAHNAAQMRQCLGAIIQDESLARMLAENGRRTILKRHTCAHRADELMHICAQLGIVGASRSQKQSLSLAGSAV